MAFSKFTVEGEANFRYHASEINDRQLLIRQDDESDDHPGEHLEQLISRVLGFPNDTEFDNMMERTSELRDEGLQNLDGVPDIVRTGMRLKITVEVLDN
jgi:hypothetical protein